MVRKARSNAEFLTMLRRLVFKQGENVVVQSPPGGGKTTIAVALVSEAVGSGRQVAVAVPRVSQAIDFALRLARANQAEQAKIRIRILMARGRTVPVALRNSLEGIDFIYGADELGNEPGIVIATIAKWSTVITQIAAEQFQLALVDEAFQVLFVDVAPLIKLAPQLLFIGDPGQLDPTVSVERERFEAGATRVLSSAPKELTRLSPDIRMVQMPLTMRLPPDTVRIISSALYPSLSFRSGVKSRDRAVRFAKAPARPVDAIDRALNLCARGATVVGILLPQAQNALDDADPELAQLGADIISRLLERGVEWRGVRTLSAEDIGYVATHVVSVDAVSRALWRSDVSTELVGPNTPEIYQGTERPIIVACHPLGTQPRFSEFDLNRGRLTVMLSRHLLRCIVIGRDGVREALRRHQHTGGGRFLGADDAEWAGWRAHTLIWDELERLGRLVRT